MKMKRDRPSFVFLFNFQNGISTSCNQVRGRNQKTFYCFSKQRSSHVLVLVKEEKKLNITEGAVIKRGSSLVKIFYQGRS